PIPTAGCVDFRHSIRSLPFLEESKGTDLNALARLRIHRRSRVIEGRVRGPTGSTIVERVIDLENKCFVTMHAWKPIPAVVGVVTYRVGLTTPAGDAARRHDQIRFRQAAGVADGQREGLDRAAGWPPDLHDCKSMAEQRVCLLREMETQALRPG